MEYTRTVTYDDKIAGRRILPFPPEQPFAGCLGELQQIAPSQGQKDALAEIASENNVFKRAGKLAHYLGGSYEPHREILGIASLAASSEITGLRLLYAALLAIPPVNTLVESLAGFSSLTRVMGMISRKEQSGEQLRESEEWFKKKVLMLSMSHPLPNSSRTSEHEPWTGWPEGVRLAIADPDIRWEEAILERAKTELEATDLRVRRIVASLDFEKKERLAVYLFTMAEETRWKIQALEEAHKEFGKATLVMQHILGERWDGIMSELRNTETGSLLVNLFKAQSMKTHPHPQVKAGTAILRALLMNPVFQRSKHAPDSLSCLALFAHSAGNGILELLFRKLPGGKSFEALLNLPGLEIRDRSLIIDLRRIPTAQFVDQEEAPCDFDWTDIRLGKGLSYKSLVLSYIDNDSFLAELLNNPKATNKPGVIPLIALRCRSMRVLSIIANRRDLYTGHSNKEVPLNLLVNPARVPLMSLRKFIHVRYVDRMTLQRMATRGFAIREEIRREVQRYLASLG